ncbi:hypothetical protein C8035_v001080 [Colletotrichum spinosum]|uniref:Uncharacterized protein n=1 Tax=Colletotrichum spinosum TaxID=1347390 RepID=A0A4R8Q116_9PEZI|nr:hypothetical protein C8035_v001080 [Colletotrichum spinosum]
MGEPLSSLSFSRLQPEPPNGEVIAGGSPPSKGSKSFYITNGFHGAGRWDSTTRTGLMNAEPLGTGGGCWTSADSDGATIGVAPCDNSDSQTFWIEAWSAPSPSGPFNIANHGLNKLTLPAEAGKALGSNENVHDNSFCFYDAASNQVIQSSKLHFAIQDITDLTGQLVPPADKPTPAISLPGCGGVEAKMTIDCAISKAVNGLPGECSNPNDSICLLHLLPAFCGDLGSVKTAGVHASDDIEACMRGISQGPCIANPGGAACLSGQFAGISFVTDNGGGGGGSSSSRIKRQNSQKCLICDEKESLVPAEDEFWIGVMKNFINSGIGLLNWFSDLAAEQLRNACLAISAAETFTSLHRTERMRRNCEAAFKFHQLVRPLDYDGDVEKAGGYLVDVLSILDGIGSVAGAAKSLASMESTVGKFAASNAKTAEIEAGYFLEAKGQSGTVRVFRDGGDGKPVPLATQADQRAMKKSMERSAFENCEKCVGVPVKRAGLLAHRQTGGLDLCCATLAEYEERPESEWSDADSDWESDSDSPDDEVIIRPPPESRTVGKLAAAAGLSTSQKTLLDGMRIAFSDFFLHGKKAPLDTDAVTKAFYDAMHVNKDPYITSKAMKLFGVTQEEQKALSEWVSYFVEDDLASAVAQIPPTTGLCLRTTNLDAKSFDMLTTFGPGLASKKTGGVYDVQDLLRIMTLGGEPIEPPEPQIMASFLGVQQEYPTSAGYRFVINSKTGRYIEPLLLDTYDFPEVDFVQGYGEFKLLGWEELNGGAAAKAAGKPGPYGIFYFDEVDLGGAKPRICGGSVTANCRPAEVEPPVF